MSLSDDRGTWPKVISSSVRNYFVKKGPPKITTEDFPKNEKGLRFSKYHCKRKLSNGETVDRPWEKYSLSSDKIFCYYCKLFDNNASSQLVNCGFDNWPNIHTRLSEHENSKKH